MQVQNTTAQEFTQRALGLFPRGWVAPEARQPGSLFYELIAAENQGPAVLIQQLLAVQNQLTMVTAEGAQLDNCARDYFGDKLPREAGESDAAYRSRILARLFLPVGTRTGMAGGLGRALGEENVIEISELNTTGTGYDGAAWGWSDWDDDGVVTPAASDWAYAPEDWDASLTYHADDLVTYNGVAWRCTAAETTTSPASGTGWQQLSLGYYTVGEGDPVTYGGAYQTFITVRQPEPIYVNGVPSNPKFMYYEDILVLANSLKPSGTVIWVTVIGPASTGGVPIKKTP